MTLAGGRMNTAPVPYQRQLLVCVNNRLGERESCGDNDGETIFKELRRIAKERGLHPRIRVTQVKCLGQCQLGVNIMVYPEGVWHSGVRTTDIDEIATLYLTDEM